MTCLHAPVNHAPVNQAPLSICTGSSPFGMYTIGTEPGKTMDFKDIKCNSKDAHTLLF